MEVMRWWTYVDWLMGIDDFTDREDYVNRFIDREIWGLC